MRNPLAQVLTMILVSTIVVSPALAQQGGNTQITRSVIAGGGGTSASGGTQLDSALGQPIVGVSSGGTASVSGGFVPVINAAPTATNGNISGQITDQSGNPIEGVVVRLTGALVRLTITDNNGNYRFDNVETSGFYILIPTRANYSFNPAQRSFSQLGQHTDAAFIAIAGAENASPLDTAEYFVRQQYLDFLNREPDQSGLEYWSAHINQCLSEPTRVADETAPACLRVRRLEVAAAFFIEQEFQESGGYVYRLYKAGYGEQESYRPGYAQFQPDRGRLVGGPNLTQGKLDFANLFVERAEFKARYPETMSAAQFVAAVLETVQQGTGLTFNSSQRDALINDVNSGGRGLMMRNLADAPAFAQAPGVYRRAFVLMEYFGYLRRDPDQAGYDFWVQVMSSAEAHNYRGMVCAFTTSAEYQRRFSAVVTHTNGECGP